MVEVNKKRDRLEIIENILTTIHKHKNQIKPTPLIRFANLSTQSFEEYILELEKNKLVETIMINQRKHYALTQRGYEFIEQYRKLRGLISEFNL